MRLFHFCFFLIGLALTTVPASAAISQNGFFDDFSSLNHSDWYASDGWTNGDHQSCEWKANAASSVDDKLLMVLSDHGGKMRPIGCPEIHTNVTLGYGLYEARMRVAAGSGLNTAFFTYVGPPTGSPEHDEIDLEFLGKDPHFVEAGYWRNGKGQPGKSIPLGFDASKEFHDYGIEWLPNKIRWYVDGKMAFETPDGANIPVHPGRLYFSLWSGAKMEDAWMGPFQYVAPKTAEVEWVGFTPMDSSCQFPQSMTCKHP